MPDNNGQPDAEAQRRRSFAIQSARLGVWELNNSDKTLLLDERSSRMLHCGGKTVIKYEQALQHVFPNDVPVVYNAVHSAVSGINDSIVDFIFRVGHTLEAVHWVHVSGQLYFDESGQVTAGAGVIGDVTDRHKKQTLDNENLLNLLRNSVPAMIFYLDAEERYSSYNETFMHWYGVDSSEVIGVRVGDFIGHDAYARIKPHLIKAYGGERVQFEMPAPVRIGPDRWLRIVYTPYKTDGKNVAGLVVHATDITDSKLTEMALRESESRFRSIFEQAPMGISLMEGRDMVITLGNDRIFEIWGKPGAAITGMPVMKALPELEGQPFQALMEAVYDTGIPHFGIGTPAMLVRNGILEQAYFDFVYTPVRNAQGNITGLMTLATEVTSRELANRAIARSEARFRQLIEEAPVATCLFTGRDMIISVANDMMLGVWGKDKSVIGKRLDKALPELKGQPFLDILDEVFSTGVPYTASAARAELEVDGSLNTYYFNFTYKPLFNESGEVYGIIDMAVDVTEQVLASQAMEKSEAALRNAVELAELGTWNIDAASGKITYSERLQQWLGVQEGRFEVQSSLNVNAADRERVRYALLKAMQKGKPGRFDEVFGISHAITGASRVIHASGQVQTDNNGNIISLSGTAQDITIQRDLQTALEIKVQTRTEELASAVEELQVMNEELAGANEQLTRSNEELAQYAYVASHDLQEPLRKILVYASRLEADKEMSAKSLDLVSRIAASSERMRLLILDLLDFSRLLQSDAVIKPVDLNTVVKDVFYDFELAAKEKNATLQLGELPVIEAVGLQMNQLFYNLISNSLKFIKPDVPPVISISAEKIAGSELKEYIKSPLSFATYHRICIRDNGIGFEKQYFDQIFEIFKRLHGKETYPGSGIGLALCRRIILNHGGVLYTESSPGEGATFFLVIPDKQADLHALMQD